MNFVSWAFVALFALVFAGRLTVGRRKTEAPYLALLLAASLVFYGWHVPWYLFILLGSTVLDFAAARAIAALPAARRGARRGWLVLSLASNLGLLGFFKYGNFAAAVAGDLAALGGGTLRLPYLEFVLPMGISFYTFQTLSYTIDVYRGRQRPLDDFGQFLLFVSFFPQLVAGPIVRAADFLPQLPRPRRLRLRVFYHGVWLLVLGFFLKMVCADNLAGYVDTHWTRGMRDDTSATFSLWVGLMFSGQIFADFCGYSLIAQGLGYLLGFRLPRNFAAPYLASSFRNFWERWHITLSRWLRDYLYLPLGGNRGSRVRTMVNLMVVMLLGGLWHGAAYTFIVWGVIHGAGLAVERAAGLHRPEHFSLPVRAAWRTVVLGGVFLGWIVFRSDTLSGAVTFIANVAAGDWVTPDRWMVEASAFLVPIAVLHAHTWLRERGRLGPPQPLVRGLCAAVMVYAIITLHGDTSDFIYFQF